jgi:hypothetical protein
MPRGVKGTRKPKKSFAQIDAETPRYNPELEGYGSPAEWRSHFRERMGFEEAERIIYGQEATPRQLLGLGEKCTWAEAKSTFRKLAFKYHPDNMVRNKMTPEQVVEGEEMFKKISAAITILAKEFGQ